MEREATPICASPTTSQKVAYSLIRMNIGNKRNYQKKPQLYQPFGIKKLLVFLIQNKAINQTFFFIRPFPYYINQNTREHTTCFLT